MEPESPSPRRLSAWNYGSDTGFWHVIFNAVSPLIQWASTAYRPDTNFLVSGTWPRNPVRKNNRRSATSSAIRVFPLSFWFPIQVVEKSTFAANSLKKQKTEQAFSGAVAVMAIVHRPLAPPMTTEGEVLPPPPPPPPLQEQKPPHVRQCSSSSLSSSSRRSSLNKHQQQRPVFLHVANVGDCRAVLCRGGSAVAITQDHTPSVPSEAARVEAAGGFVSRGRVNGILGVSRSFGDIHCKVMHTEVRICEACSGYRFLRGF